MPYPIKAHTLLRLEQILQPENLNDCIAEFSAKHGKEYEKFHNYLVSLYNSGDGSLSPLGSLYNFIYSQLGTCQSPNYAAGSPIDTKAYTDACKASGKWEIVGFQSSPGYLICDNEQASPDERIILNFNTQPEAFAFAGILKDSVDATVSFKILLATADGALNVTTKNDKIVIYYPKSARDSILTLVNAIPARQLQPSISGFYLKVKDGVGLAAETDDTWSYTMYSAEYCMKYLINQYEAHGEITAAGMYDYAIHRLVKKGRIPSELVDPADLPAAE